MPLLKFAAYCKGWQLTPKARDHGVFGSPHGRNSPCHVHTLLAKRRDRGVCLWQFTLPSLTDNTNYPGAETQLGNPVIMLRYAHTTHFGQEYKKILRK